MRASFQNPQNSREPLFTVKKSISGSTAKNSPSNRMKRAAYVQSIMKSSHCIFFTAFAERSKIGTWYCAKVASSKHKNVHTHHWIGQWNRSGLLGETKTIIYKGQMLRMFRKTSQKHFRRNVEISYCLPQYTCSCRFRECNGNEWIHWDHHSAVPHTVRLWIQSRNAGVSSSQLWYGVWPKHLKLW